MRSAVESLESSFHGWSLNRERLQHIWERVKSEISKQDSRIRSELQEIDGKASDVWRWVKSAASPKKSKTVSSTLRASHRPTISLSPPVCHRRKRSSIRLGCRPDAMSQTAQLLPFGRVSHRRSSILSTRPCSPATPMTTRSTTSSTASKRDAPV